MLGKSDHKEAKTILQQRVISVLLFQQVKALYVISVARGLSI